jgi:bifunctional enzyme CysN/CysC
VVGDTPGHEQYTRNMATGLNAELAVILVTSQRPPPQTLHSIMLCLAFASCAAVNKLDLVGFDQAAFDAIASDFRMFTERLTIKSLQAIPISARHGDNVSIRSARTPWYRGPHLFEYLETVDVGSSRITLPFRMAVQWVNRPYADFRGLAGTLASGNINAGDEIVVATSAARARIARSAFTAGGDPDTAYASDDAVTLELADNVDAGRGDLWSTRRTGLRWQTSSSRHYLIWMSEEGCCPGAPIWMKISGRTLRNRH